MSPQKPSRETKLVADFLDAIAAERGAAANTLESYGRDLRAYIAHLAKSGRSAREATADDVRSFLKAGADAGLGPATLARRRSSLRQFHKHLYLENLASDDPTIGVEAARRGRPLPKILSVDDVGRLIATAHERGRLRQLTGSKRLAALRMACLIELLYGGGFRVSELIALPGLRRPRQRADC